MHGVGLRRSRRKESYPQSFLPRFLLGARASGHCSGRGGQAAKEKEFLSLQSGGPEQECLHGT